MSINTHSDTAVPVGRTFRLGDEREVGRIGFGAMRLTGQPGNFGPYSDWDAGKALLRRAVELCVTFLDTAHAYGPGWNETLISEALHPYPAGLVIATKVGITKTGPTEIRTDGRPTALRAQAEESLRRLRLERLDLLQLHRPDPAIPLAEQVGTLARLREEGKVGLIGLSNVSREQLEAALAVTPVASVQNRFNPAERGDDALVDPCAAHGIAFVPHGPLGAHPPAPRRCPRGGGPEWRGPGHAGAAGSRLAARPFAQRHRHPGHDVGRPPRREPWCLAVPLTDAHPRSWSIIMVRRTFLSQATAAAVGAAAGPAAAQAPAPEMGPTWKLRFAPHIGLTSLDTPLFKDSVGTLDPVAHIDFIADLGFAGIEDNLLKLRPAADQERIGQALARRGLAMGCFVNNAADWNKPLWCTTDAGAQEKQQADLLASIETAKRVGGKCLTTISGRDLRLPLRMQLQAMVENLKRLSDTAERAGVVIGIEATNEQGFPALSSCCHRRDWACTWRLMLPWMALVPPS